MGGRRAATPDMSELADTLEALGQKHREPWRIVNEPHRYPDGTSHFTHVRYDARVKSGETVTVTVAGYVTPELAELLCVLHNNLGAIAAALRQTKSN